MSLTYTMDKTKSNTSYKYINNISEAKRPTGSGNLRMRSYVLADFVGMLKKLVFGLPLESWFLRSNLSPCAPGCLLPDHLENKSNYIHKSVKTKILSSHQASRRGKPARSPPGPTQIKVVI